MECPACKEVVPPGETMSHICPGTWFGDRNGYSEPPALDSELNPTNAPANHLLPHHASASSFADSGAAINSFSSTSSVGIAATTSISLTPSTDPSTQNDRVTADSDVESVGNSDDSSSTIVPRVPTPRPRPSQNSYIQINQASTASEADSTPPITSSTEPAIENNNTRVNGNIASSSVVNSNNSTSFASAPSSTIPPTFPANTNPSPAPRTRARSNTNSTRNIRPRSDTQSFHTFDFVPEETEPFPEFVDSIAGGVTTAATENRPIAPLPSAEVLARRRRREEIHFSDHVRANILANVFGRTGAASDNGQQPVLPNGINTASHNTSSYSPVSRNSQAQATYEAAVAAYDPNFDPVSTSHGRVSAASVSGQRSSASTSTQETSSPPHGAHTSYGQGPLTSLTNGFRTGSGHPTANGQPSSSTFGQLAVNTQPPQPPSYAEAPLTNTASAANRPDSPPQLVYAGYTRTFSFGPNARPPTYTETYNYSRPPTAAQTSAFQGQSTVNRLAPFTYRQQGSIVEEVSDSDTTSTSGQTSSSHQASASSGRASISEQDSHSQSTSTEGRSSTLEQPSTSGSATNQERASTFEQASSSSTSSISSTGSSNINQHTSGNNSSSGPEDCLPYFDGISPFRRDEDEGDDGPSSTGTSSFPTLNNAYSGTRMSLNSNSTNHSGNSNNTGGNSHNANTSQGLFTNFLDNSNNNTSGINMSRQGTPSASPGPQHAASQVNGASGMPGMGMGMNMPMNAGHQMDLNHLYEMVLELSDVLKNNRDMTKGIINSAEEIMRRATSEEAGPTLQQVNGEITAGRIAELERALAREKRLNEVLKREQAENTKLIGEYEAAVGTMVEQIRNYCQNNNMHYLAQKRHYNNLLQVERDAHLQCRLERDEWEAKTLRCAEMIRTAYRLRCEEEEVPIRVVQGLQNEVRAYRNALGMEPEKPEEEYGWEVLKDAPGGPDLGID